MQVQLPEALAQSGAMCSCIVDALGRTHSHRTHLLDLVSPTPGQILFGPAATLSFVPVRDDLMDPETHNFARLFYEAVGEAPEGKVLVMASNGHPEISLAGGTKLSRLHNHGLAGLLCDGRLRDFAELKRYDFVAYCKGASTRWGGDVLMPFEANRTAVVDGVTVSPGDYIYADASGAVVIPPASVEAVLEEAVRVMKEDAEFLRQIRGEDPRRILETGGRER